MTYELTDAHKLIRDTARRIAREKVAPRAAELDDSGEHPHDLFAVFREAGLLGLAIPPEYGGSGAGFLALALAVEEVAKYCNSSALILLLSALSTQPINLGGSEEQKRQWLPRPPAGGGEGGRAYRTVMLTPNPCRPVVGARGLGLAEGPIAYALDYARERKTFGKPQVEHQAIQMMLAEAALQIEAARHLVYHAASLVAEGKYDRQHAPYLSIAKTFATEMCI